MTRLAQTVVIHDLTTSSSGPSVMQRLRRHFARVEAAMASQSRLSEILPETLSDTGLSAEALTGVPSHDPDLPFFYQSGFGRQ